MVVNCCSVQRGGGRGRRRGEEEEEGRKGGSSDKRRISRLIKPFETKNHTTVIYNSLYQLTRLIFICHITRIPYLPRWVQLKKSLLLVFNIMDGCQKRKIGGNKNSYMRF